MKTTHIIAATFGILFLIYIVSFKVYRIQKRPTWKALAKEMKLAFAERLIYFSLYVMPNGKEKKALAKIIVAYVEGIVENSFDCDLNSPIPCQCGSFIFGMSQNIIKCSNCSEPYKSKK